MSPSNRSTSRSAPASTTSPTTPRASRAARPSVPSGVPRVAQRERAEAGTSSLSAAGVGPATPPSVSPLVRASRRGTQEPERARRLHLGARRLDRQPLDARLLQPPDRRVRPDRAAAPRCCAPVDHPDEPHFAILDEMNLAKVEYYFSDFLSAMESGTEMVLHDAGDEVTVEIDGDAGHRAPSGSQVPRNVFFTGTVNVDETTYMFSPKVLDRANVIEFHDVDLRAMRHGPRRARRRLPAGRRAPTSPALLKHRDGAYEWAGPATSRPSAGRPRSACSPSTTAWRSTTCTSATGWPTRSHAT